MKTKRSTAKLLLQTLCLVTLNVQTNQAEAFLAGSKATGMAATGVAYPQDAYAAAYNPAGLAELEGRFDIGFTWMRNHGEAKLDLSPEPVKRSNGKYNPFSSPNLYLGDFGISKNFSSTLCNQKWEWAIGLVLYNRDYIKTNYHKRLPLVGKSTLGMEYLHEIASPSISLRLTEEHTVGISLDVNLARLKISGLEKLSHSFYSVAPSKVTNHGYAYSSGIGSSIGWLWQAYEGLTFGVAWHSKVHMRKFHAYRGIILQGGRIDSPERWDLGLAYQFLPCATFTFDFEWVNWQTVKALHNTLAHDGKIHKLGSNDGPGFGFRNQLIYRFGVDYAYDEAWTFRMGYSHSNAAIKANQTFMNLLTVETVKNYFTLGATYNFGRAGEISFFYQHGFENTIDGKHAALDIIGQGRINLTQSKDCLGLSWGYLF
jgi:long-chain fatty acid transport protein